MSLFLALDQSTSATKALLFDGQGRALDRESREHRQYYPQPGWVEHDANEIWGNTLTVLRALLARHSENISKLASLSITNQRETIVVFERGSGRPLAPAMVWQCRRGVALCDEHRTAGHETETHEKTGLKIDAYFSASKLLWLAQNRPEIHAKLADGSALIGTIDAYLIYRLTGGKTFATDSTNASRTLLFDIRNLRWDEALCALWQVPVKALPDVRESSARFGETTLGGLLPRALPICGVMGDSQASLFAQRCFEPGAAKVTFGTGSSLLLNIGSTMRLSSRGVVTTLAWVFQGKPVYAFEGIIISSASTLNWLRDQLGLAKDIAELEKLAIDARENGGVYLVPAFAGLGLPHWQAEARATIVGLSSHSDRRHVARAAFESIALQIRDALEAMRADAGVALGTLHADGGPTASQFLMQLTADVTTATLRVPAMADCSPLGAVLAGQLGLGLHYSLADLAAHSPEDVYYTPSLDPLAVEQLTRGWNHAVRQLLSSTA
ncbi:FGGY-family carbohydrate kinase [Oleiharenicola lentus]|uniref:FGGY-family carbohydrate kinase n=1 Tax=Oleiharenicola lentus TaxID=2508720 RepID=UPI003F66D0A3